MIYAKYERLLIYLTISVPSVLPLNIEVPSAYLVLSTPHNGNSLSSPYNHLPPVLDPPPVLLGGVYHLE